MIYAVCALLVKNNKVLTVSRKDNPKDIGLPGGKIEVGETPIQALKREVLEETGLNVLAYHSLMTAVCGNVLVSTYQVNAWNGIIHSKEAGIVAWNTWDRLLRSETSFYEYNILVRKAHMNQPL